MRKQLRKTTKKIGTLLMVFVMLFSLTGAGTAEGEPSGQNELCTKAEDCTAVIHDEGCPAAANMPAPVVCTGAEGCPAEVHAEGCPHNPAATLVGGTACTCTELCTEKSSKCPVCAEWDYAVKCMVCICTAECTEQNKGCNVCREDHKDCRGTCTMAEGCDSPNHAAGCPEVGCICTDKCTDNGNAVCPVCAESTNLATDCYGRKLPDITVDDTLRNFEIGGKTMQTGAIYRANETQEEAEANGYSDWSAEFYLTFYSSKSEIDLVNCGIGGVLLGAQRAVMIDEPEFLVVNAGEPIPIVRSLAVLEGWDIQITWKTVCMFSEEGHDFTCGIVISDELLRDPDFKVGLELVLTNPSDPAETITLDEINYTVQDFGYVASLNGETAYPSLEDAVDAAHDGDTVKVLASHALDDTVTIDENITLDFNGCTVTTTVKTTGTTTEAVNPAFRILGDVTVTDSNPGDDYSVDGVTDDGDGYCFIVGSAEGAGSLTVASGSYYGACSAVSVTSGELSVEGGSFHAEIAAGYTDNRFLLNCYDENYPDNAKITVTGGTFYGFNPDDNLAEGEGTDFVPDTHYAEQLDGTVAAWTVAEKTAVTVTVDSFTVGLGAELPEFTYTAEGIADGDDITVAVSCAANNADTLGNYDITASVSGSDAYKYTFTVIDGTLTVQKMELTVTVADKSKVYGESDPVFTGTVLFNGESQLPDGIVVTYNRAVGENVGTYIITAQVSGEGSEYFDITVTNGALTVTPKAVTVKANDVTVKLGDPMPELTATTTGLSGSDVLNITLSTEAEDTAAAGTYAITALVTGNTGNYEVTVLPGTLTVSDLNLDTDDDGMPDENIDADGNGIPEYSIIAGMNSKYTAGQNDGLTFTGNGTLSRFVELKVDDKVVDKDNYTAVSGSTVVMLKTSYLSTLSVGEHTLTLVYTDGTASCTFTVAGSTGGSAGAEDPAGPSGSAGSGTADGTTGPNTGDSSRMDLWLILFAVSFAAAMTALLVLGSRKRSRR